MDNSTIGIKIADGTYFPILEESGTGKKKLVLTTVNDDQGSVQIDLYKGEGQELHDAMYIGSLVIEDIMPAMKGDPEIELIIGVDDDGNLNAEAGDAGSTERQSLSVSLKSLNEAEFSAPNFELDDSELVDVENEDNFTFEEDDLSLEEVDPFDETEVDELSPIDDDMVFDEVPLFEDEIETEEIESEEISSLDDNMSFDEIALDDELSFEEQASFEEEPSFEEQASFEEPPSFESEPDSLESVTEDDENFKEEYKKKRRPIALIILIILILAILGLGALLIMRGMNSDTVPPLEAENTPAVTAPELAAEAEPAEPEPPAPVEEKVVEAVEPPVEPPVEVVKQAYDTLPPEGHGGGVWYRLKWGDTLWDLSNSFYRTPWLYGLIAVENKIKNPDVIYAGTDILIPEN